LLRLELPLTFK